MSRGGKQEEKPYRLISVELPEWERVARALEYDELLNEFVKSGHKTVRVEYPGKSTNALMSALKMRAKKRDLKVKVASRKGRLYLTKA